MNIENAHKQPFTDIMRQEVFDFIKFVNIYLTLQCNLHVAQVALGVEKVVKISVEST